MEDSTKGKHTKYQDKAIHKQETPSEALKFILVNKKSYFLKFSEGFEIEVRDAIRENWKPAELKKRYNDAGITYPEKTIRNWQNDESVPTRENAIHICFVLGLSLEKSTLFLCRSCDQGPLNVKDPNELIYYYCLKYGKPYKVAVKLKKDYQTAASEIDKCNGDTTAIINWIENVGDNDTEFINKLSSYGSILNTKSATLNKLFEVYLNLLKKKISEKLKCDIDTLNNNKIIELLFGYEYMENGKKSRDISFKDSSLKNYKQITENFPTRKRLDAIKDGKSPGRKDIIIIYFFCIFYNFNKNNNDHFDKFYTELNKVLEKCRMSPLYSRSRFDWMILNAVNNSAPDDYLNDIIGRSFPE